MRHCGGCNSDKDESEFDWKNKAKGIKQRHCKICQSKTTSKHYRENAAAYKKRSVANKERAQRFILDYLSKHPCVDCGESDPIVLDFDHTHKKVRGISQMVLYGRTNEALLQEIAKCEVRCANCHRRKTAKQYGWFKFLVRR